MLPKTNLGRFNDRLYLSFLLRLSILLFIATFRPFSDGIHLVITASICCVFCLVSLAPLVFNLNWRKWRTFIIKPLPFYSVSFRVSDVPVGRILDRLFFSFLVLFYFPLSMFFFLFFSYLWDNYRTLLITVLFIRTDRLSCINFFFLY